MSKTYFETCACDDVGSSEGWEVGRQISLEKWREIRRNGEKYYHKSERCGFCFVARNRGYTISPLHSGERTSCIKCCPAKEICMKLLNEEITSARRIIRMIKDLKIKRGR